MKQTDGFNPKSIINKLAVTKIETDISSLDENQVKLVKLLTKSVKIIDEIYRLQKHPDNIVLKEEIDSSDDPYLQLYFKIMAGPLDQFNNDEPFIEKIKKSDKANFYPHDLTINDWEKYLSKNSSQKDDLVSPYTMIVKNNEELTPVKYSEYFRKDLSKIIRHLKEALEFSENILQKSYFESLINAFTSNDFAQADIQWMQVRDNDIFILMGPHEFYDDKFLGYKSSFTGIVGIKNKNEFSKLELIEKNLDLLEARLPIDKPVRPQKLSDYSRIEIIDVIYNSGDARYPIPAIAFNLPNSQKIRSEYGSKKILLYNIIDAKFNSIIMPIAEKILDDTKIEKVTFNANFNLILMHEISHELGTKLLKDSDGKLKEMNYYLKDLYPILEESKADVMGIHLLIILIKEGLVTDSSLPQVYKTYLINLIRALRFGIENAHGLASLIQINFLTLEEVFIFKNYDDLITIDYHQFEKSIEKLLTIILALISEGNYQKADNFIKEHSKMSKDIKNVLDRVSGLPIDILPWYPKSSEKKPLNK